MSDNKGFANSPGLEKNPDMNEYLNSECETKTIPIKFGSPKQKNVITSTCTSINSINTKKPEQSNKIISTEPIKVDEYTQIEEIDYFGIYDNTQSDKLNKSQYVQSDLSFNKDSNSKNDKPQNRDSHLFILPQNNELKIQKSIKSISSQKNHLYKKYLWMKNIP